MDPIFGTQVHPNTFMLERGARSEITWLGQAEFCRFPTEETPILPLSSEISGDGFTCRVGATAAVSCRDDHTGRGFGFSPND